MLLSYIFEGKYIMLQGQDGYPLDMIPSTA